MKFLFALMLNFVVALSVGHAQTIQGKGSSFPLALYLKWAAIYQKQTGVTIDYTDIGTTAGLDSVKKGLATFAASNRPMKEEELEAHGLLQFPVVMSGVVPVVNMVDVRPGRLRLSSSVLVGICTGKITRWTDPAIRQLNPDVFLPAAPITVLTRQDSSGMTYLLSHYLSRANPEWKSRIGVGPDVKFPVGLAVNGLDSTLAQLIQHPNSIAFVDYATVRKNRLTYVQLQNKAGHFVAPNFGSFQAAARGFLWQGAMDNTTTDAPDPSAWPIASPSYVIVRHRHKNNNAAVHMQQALAFFEWAAGHGDQIADDMNFVPMPLDVKMAVIRSVSERLLESEHVK
jgi:phosphate transport system substrate-binding protein